MSTQSSGAGGETGRPRTASDSESDYQFAHHPAYSLRRGSCPAVPTAMALSLSLLKRERTPQKYLEIWKAFQRLVIGHDVDESGEKLVEVDQDDDGMWVDQLAGGTDADKRSVRIESAADKTERTRNEADQKFMAQIASGGKSMVQRVTAKETTSTDNISLVKNYTALYKSTSRTDARDDEKPTDIHKDAQGTGSRPVEKQFSADNLSDYYYHTDKPSQPPLAHDQSNSIPSVANQTSDSSEIDKPKSTNASATLFSDKKSQQQLDDSTFLNQQISPIRGNRYVIDESTPIKWLDDENFCAEFPFIDSDDQEDEKYFGTSDKKLAGNSNGDSQGDKAMGPLSQLILAAITGTVSDNPPVKPIEKTEDMAPGNCKEKVCSDQISDQSTKNMSVSITKNNDSTITITFSDKPAPETTEKNSVKNITDQLRDIPDSASGKGSIAGDKAPMVDHSKEKSVSHGPVDRTHDKKSVSNDRIKENRSVGTNQPTDKASVTDQSLDKASVTHHSTDKASETGQPADNASVTDQFTDKVSVTDQFTDKVSVTDQSTDKPSVTDRSTDKTPVANQDADKASVTNQSTDKASVTNQSTDKPSLTNQSTDKPSLTIQSTDKASEPSESITRPPKRHETRSVHFSNSPLKVYSTYGPDEYDRKSFVDPFIAMSIFELERRLEKMEIFEIELEKGSDGRLGFDIVGMGLNADRGDDNLSIFIRAIIPNGLADKDGRLNVWDQIVEVDGTTLVGVSQHYAAYVLRNTAGRVKLKIARDKDAENSEIAKLCKQHP